MSQQTKPTNLELAIAGIIVAFWVVAFTVVFGIVKVHDVWPAFIVLVFFFLGGQDVNNFKNIFPGAAVGLLLAGGLPLAVGFLMSSLGMGHEAAVLLVVAVIIFLLVALSGVAHMFFNNYGFVYFTIALIYGPKQATVTWLLVLLVGGALFSGAIILSIKLIGSVLQKRAGENVVNQ